MQVIEQLLFVERLALLLEASKVPHLQQHIKKLTDERDFLLTKAQIIENLTAEVVQYDENELLKEEITRSTEQYHGVSEKLTAVTEQYHGVSVKLTAVTEQYHEVSEKQTAVTSSIDTLKSESWRQAHNTTTVQETLQFYIGDAVAYDAVRASAEFLDLTSASDEATEKDG